MAEMGNYCKAYLLKDLRAFDGWIEKSENACQEKKVVDGQEVEMLRELTDESIVYVQENHVVTDGIYKDENIIFGNVSSEWVAYCQQTLKFEVPKHEPISS
jgi:hypothetical protein